jgi:hypothetical protein
MLMIATSAFPRRFANAPTHPPSYRNPGYSQRVFYCDHAIFFLIYAHFSSLWIYGVQGETEGDFRRGDKRCVNQKYFNVRNRWKVKIDWVGADVLVVAPTGMGKVSVSHFTLRLDLLMLQRSYQSICFQVPAIAQAVRTPFSYHKWSI